MPQSTRKVLTQQGRAAGRLPAGPRGSWGRGGITEGPCAYLVRGWWLLTYRPLGAVDREFVYLGATRTFRKRQEFQQQLSLQQGWGRSRARSKTSQNHCSVEHFSATRAKIIIASHILRVGVPIVTDCSTKANLLEYSPGASQSSVTGCNSNLPTPHTLGARMT